MKIYSQASILLLVGAVALLPACKPQGTNITKLNDVQRRNAILHQEIAEMRALIQRKGADIPDLAEKLDARAAEEQQAYIRLTSLREKETALRLRRIELESRLNSFRSAFSELQSQISASIPTEQP